MRRIIQILIIINLSGGLSYGQNLDDYFRIAAENNPGLQAKYKSYEAAMQKVAQVSALPDPTFSFGYFLESVETRVGPQRAKFSLSQMFPWFGTLSAQGDAAALMAEAKFQDFIDARNRLYYQVSAAYYPLFERARLAELEQTNIEILQSYKSIVTTKFKNGTGSMVDVLRVDMTLKDAQTSVKILQDQQKPLRTTINKLLNRAEDTPVQIADTLKVEAVKMATLKDSMLARNPRLQELELKYRSAQAAENAAVKQGLPKFGLGIDYVLVDERTDLNVADNGKDVIMPMISVSIPIFRGKYKAARKEARLMQQSYLMQKAETQNRLIENFESTLFEIGRQRDLIELYEQQISESQQALNLIYSDYANSGKAFEEVLRMEQQLIRYKRMKASALARLHIKLAELNYITANDN